MSIIRNFLERFVNTSDVKEAKTIISLYSDQLALKTLAVNMAITFVSQTIGKCEFKTYRNNKEVKEGLYYLLNVQPNINQNASQFKNEIIEKLILQNHSLVFEDNDSLFVADTFIPIKNGTNEYLFTNISVDQGDMIIDKLMSDVFYFKLNNVDIKKCLDGMYSDYESILSAAVSLYKQGASEKYILDLASTQIGDDEFNKKFNAYIEDQLKSFLKSDKAVLPQYQGMKLEKFNKGTGITNANDIVSLRKEVYEIVASAFHIPVSMLYGNMTNSKEIINSFITFTIEPYSRMISEELTRKTTNFYSWSNGEFIKVDTTSINHQDIFDIAQNVDKLIASGYYCVDEVRTKLGEEALNTEFSTQHWMTKNYGRIEDVANADSDTKGGD